MSPADALVLLLWLFVFAIAIFIAMAFLFAALTGWSALARRYPEHGTEHGERYRLRGVVVGEWGWSAPPATGYLDDYGILLVAKSPFGVPFRPIHVPWGDVKNVTRRKYMFFEVVEMRYGKLAARRIGFAPSPFVSEIEKRLDLVF
jgi:hypothetical protein